MAKETLKLQKTATPIFDGGVLRGRSYSYSISLDGLLSIEYTLNKQNHIILNGREYTCPFFCDFVRIVNRMS